MSADSLTKPTVEEFRGILARQQMRREEEKKLLARKMHDDLSQKATVLVLELSLLDMDMGTISPQGAKEKIAELSALADDLGRAIREITTQVRPKVMDEFGLVPGLQTYAKSLQGEMACIIHNPAADLVLPASIASGLFNLAQDIVACVFHPVQASCLDVRLEQTEKEVQFRISGEHKGVRKPATKEARLDWLGIQESALTFGGRVKIKTVPGVGTSVTCSIPRILTEKKTVASPAP